MSLDLSDDEIHGLIAYARDKLGDERYPFAPALRPTREPLAKLDPKPRPEPLPLRKPSRAEPSAGKEEQAAALSGRLFASLWLRQARCLALLR